MEGELGSFEEGGEKDEAVGSTSGEQQVPPVSRRSRVGMTKPSGERVGLTTIAI